MIQESVFSSSSAPLAVLGNGRHVTYVSYEPGIAPDVCLIIQLKTELPIRLYIYGLISIRHIRATRKNEKYSTVGTDVTCTEYCAYVHSCYFINFSTTPCTCCLICNSPARRLETYGSLWHAMRYPAHSTSLVLFAPSFQRTPWLVYTEEKCGYSWTTASVSLASQTQSAKCVCQLHGQWKEWILHYHFE